MKTIKKTTLIAAITAMAAFAVPAMASAAVWGPLNTNKTLTSTSSARYVLGYPSDLFSFECSSSTLGTHVRTPASSTLDITSASFTGCVSLYSSLFCGVSVTTTGLPWAATWSPGAGVSFTEHLQVTYTGQCGPATLTVDGPTDGDYSNTTHTLSASARYGTGSAGMSLYYMGTFMGHIGNTAVTTWKDATNTLNLT